MRRFRLRHLWKVNCEALVTATGQNLKRLLKKRGWGRRPFPTEAMVLMSPGSDEVEMFPETALLRSQRANVAVASLVFWEITTRFFMAQKSLFSPENIAHVIFVLCSLYIILSIYYCFYRFCLYFLLWEKLWSVYLINFIISPTESFSTGCGRFWHSPLSFTEQPTQRVSLPTQCEAVDRTRTGERVPSQKVLYLARKSQSPCSLEHKN